MMRMMPKEEEKDDDKEEFDDDDDLTKGTCISCNLIEAERI